MSTSKVELETCFFLSLLSYSLFCKAVIPEVQRIVAEILNFDLNQQQKSTIDYEPRI